MPSSIGKSSGSRSLEGRSVGSYRSRRQLEMPDWVAVQEDYIKSIRSGRHPVSFKHKGELWHHCDATSKRLERVSKGHSLVNVINEDSYVDIDEEVGEEDYNLDASEEYENDAHSSEEASTTPTLLGTSVDTSRSGTPQSGVTTVGGVKMKKEDADLIKNLMPKNPGKLAPVRPSSAKGEKSLALIDFQLNGVNVDVRFSSSVCFGQLVVILNDVNEVLCVDEKNSIRIKNKSELKQKDKICFKVVDLREMSNPSTVKFGEPMWLQAVDTPEPGDNIDTNFFTSFVLGSKIFQLATINTQQLNKKWAQPGNKKRDEIFKREEEVDSDEEYDKRMAELERIEREKKEAEEAAKRPKSKGRGWGALKKQNIKKTTTMVKKAQVKEKKEKRAEDDEEGADNKELVGEVCGSAIAVKLAFNEHGGLQDEGMRNEVVSKEALNLGLFVPQPADSLSRPDFPAPYSAVYSNRPIFLSQDLYCLGNSSGSSYRPWPLRSSAYSADSHAHNITALEGEGKGEQSIVAIDQQNHHGKAMKQETQQKRIRGKRGNKKTTQGGDYGVLRKIVKRGAEYEYAVDRKCVWRLCHVDNVTDGHQMTTAEKTTAKTMSIAKDKLRKSEMRRKGHKTYEGSRWIVDQTDPDINVVPSFPAQQKKKSRIPAGERFALDLRRDASTHLLDKETQLLEIRREKEQVMKDYLESQISQWDSGNADFPVDAKSMCSQMTFEYTKADSMRSQDSAMQGGFATSDDASHESKLSEDEQAQIMLPIGHEQAYMERQKKVLRQKTLGLRRYHFQQYPYFYKSPPKGGLERDRKPRELDPLDAAKRTYNKHFAFNSPLLSAGEKLTGLRQAFEGIYRGDFDTRRANNGVDDSVEVIWSASGERIEVVDHEKEKAEAERIAQEKMGIRKSRGMLQEEPEETAAALKQRLLIEKHRRILANQDDLMWKSVQHRRKLDAAREIQEAIKDC